MNRKLVKELAEFFVNYRRQDAIKYKFLGTKGAKEAARLLDQAIKRGKAAYFGTEFNLKDIDCGVALISAALPRILAFEGEQNR